MSLQRLLGTVRERNRLEFPESKRKEMGQLDFIQSFFKCQEREGKCQVSVEV